MFGLYQIDELMAFGHIEERTIDLLKRNINGHSDLLKEQNLYLVLRTNNFFVQPRSSSAPEPKNRKPLYS